jgi:excisionase family DNA binding protein
MEPSSVVSRDARRRQSSDRRFPQNPEGFPAAPPEGEEVTQGFVQAHHWNARAPPHGGGAMGVKEFCNWAGIGPSTFYKEVNNGQIRVVKVGRKTLVRMSDAVTWLNGLDEPDPGERYGSPKARRTDAPKLRRPQKRDKEM